LALGFFGKILDYIFSPSPASSPAAPAQEAKPEWVDGAVVAGKAAGQAKKDDDAKLLAEWNRKLKASGGNEASGSQESQKTIGGGGLKPVSMGTNFFGDAKSTAVDLQPGGTGIYPTSKFSTLEKLQGAAYFLGNAAAAVKSEDYEGLRFLGDQADKVIQGQPTDVECKLAPLPTVPAPANPEAAFLQKQRLSVLISAFKEDVAALQATEVKIVELDVRAKEATRKRETAQLKLKEVEAKVAAAKPEEKAQADEMEKQARLLLQEAEDQLTMVNQEQASKLMDKEKLRIKLLDIDNEIKNIGK